MPGFHLEHFEVVGINFSKNPQPDVKVNIMTSISYNVRYAKDADRFIGDAVVLIQDPEHKDFFNLEVHSVGFFTYDFPEMTTDLKRIIHVESAKVLLPHWNSSLACVLRVLDVPPVMLSPLGIDPKDVFIKE